MNGSGNFTPTATPSRPTNLNAFDIGLDGITGPVESTYQGNSSGGLMTTNNFITFPATVTSALHTRSATDEYVETFGRGPNLRAEYAAKIAGMSYPDHPDSQSLTGVFLPNPNTRLTYANMTTTGFSPNIPYTPKFSPSTYLKCGITGYNKPYVG